MANDSRYARIPSGAIPIFGYRDAAAERAWRLHRAMQLVEQREPLLADDPLFRDFKGEAYARFEQCFERAR